MIEVIGMDMVTYKIGKLTFTQNELTWKQDKQLLKLANSFAGIADSNENIVIPRVFETLQKYDMLGVMLGIILQPKWDWRYCLYFAWQLLKLPFTRRIQWVNVDELSNTEIKEIKEDFFLFNKSVMKKLSDVSNALGWIAKAGMQGETPETNLQTKPKKPKTQPQMSAKP